MRGLSSISFQFLVALIGFIIPSLLTRILGIDGYGLYVLYVSVLGVLSSLFTLGIGSETKRTLPTLATKAEQIILTVVTLFRIYICVLVCSVIAYSLNEYFNNRNLHLTSTVIFFFIIATAHFKFISDFFRYTGKTVTFSLIIFLQAILFLGWLTIMRAYNYNINLNTVFVALVLLNIIISCTATFLLILNWRLEFNTVKPIPIFSEIKFGLPLIIAYFITGLILIGDRYVIAYLMDTTAVGIYNVIYLVGAAPIAIAKLLVVIFQPILNIEHTNGSQLGEQKLIKAISNIYLVMSLSWIAFCYIFGETIFVVYLDQTNISFASNGGLVVAIATVFYGLYVIQSSIFFIKKESGRYLIFTIIGSLIFFTSCFALVSFYENLLAASCSYLIVSILHCLSLYYYARKYWGLMVIDPGTLIRVVASLSFSFFVYRFSEVLLSVNNNLYMMLSVSGTCLVLFLFCIRKDILCNLKYLSKKIH